VKPKQAREPRGLLSWDVQAAEKLENRVAQTFRSAVDRLVLQVAFSR